MEENTGIVPVSIDLTHFSEYRDRFFTTDADTITYESFLVTRSTTDKEVTITSCLSSNRFEKYALMYPENEDFAKLYRYSVSVTAKVLGDESKQDSENTITADCEIKDGVISLRTKWFGKAKVQFSCASPGGTKISWVSSNDKIKADSNGLVALYGRDGESCYVTAAVIGENNVVLSISRVKLNFEKPKFNLIEYLRDFFEYVIELIKNAF